MRRFAALLFYLTLAGNLFAQGDLFISEDGRTYSSSQVDSLKAHGNFVTTKERLRRKRQTVYDLYFYDKSKFQEKGFYCGNDRNRLTIPQIKKLFPYDRTQTIQLVSFDSTGRSRQIPKRNGQVDPYGFCEIKTLDERLSNQMLDVLANFSFDSTNAKKVEQGIMICYEPRNAILFVDSQGHIIAYLEICFECLQYKIEPSHFINPMLDCWEKFDIIQDIFRRAGVRYGITYTEQWPSFPGGEEAKNLYFKKNFRRVPGTTGYKGRVFVGFTVNSDGTLSDVEVIKSLCDACDKFAVELVKKMPKWIPQTGADERPMKSTHQIIPVSFP